MSENQATLRYSYRLRPGKIAETKLLSDWNCCRWVWNQCVQAGNESHQLFKKGLKHECSTFCRMSKQLTAWRKEHKWLAEGSQVTQQQTIRNWSREYQRAFKSSKGFPTFRAGKIALPTLEYTARGFSIKDEKLFLVGGISIPVVWSRKLPSDPKTVTITRDSDGHWYASFVVKRENPKLPPSDKGVGIDWGVKKVANTDQGEEFDLECGNQIKKNENALKQAQQKLSKAKKGSQHRRNARKKVAKIHLNMRNQRKDRAFKWSRKIVREFGYIAIEDFKPKFLHKTRMAKKATDGAVGMTKQILITMAEQAGRTVDLVDPAFTTMTCSNCGTIAKQRILLNVRTFQCDHCGFTADRDWNAARTIFAKAGFDLANVDDVRPSHDSGCVVAI